MGESSQRDVKEDDIYAAPETLKVTLEHFDLKELINFRKRRFFSYHQLLDVVLEEDETDYLYS